MRWRKRYERGHISDQPLRHPAIDRYLDGFGNKALLL